MAKKSTHKPLKVNCPHCSKTVTLVRDAKGRWVVGLGGATVGGVVGGIVGAGIGLATGGWGMAATIPLGIAAGTIVGGSGYIIGDKLIDKIKCPACEGKINLGV